MTTQVVSEENLDLSKPIIRKKSISAVNRATLRTEIDCGEFGKVVTDEPVAHGGTGEGPSPLQAVLAALCGCESVTFSRTAAEMDFQYEGIEFDAMYTIDIRGRMGARSVVPHFQTVRVQATVLTRESEERLRAVVEETEVRCPVLNLIIVAHPTFSAATVRDLVALAKATPLAYGSPGAGTTGHLGGELLDTLAGIKMQHVPYKGAGPAVNDLLGGQIKVAFTAVPPAAPHIKSQRLRAIAVTTRRRTASLPDVPTVAEAGFPDYEVDNMYGVIGTAGTPAHAVTWLNREISRIVTSPDVKPKLESQGFDPVGSSVPEFSTYLKAEARKWAKVVKDSGARVE